MSYSYITTSSENPNEHDINNKPIIIQTHDKRFHVDDVGAVSILSTYFNQKNTEIQLIRSREPDLLNKADILIDVGSTYDPTTKRFDHHQEECNEVFDNGFTIPLSSIGMVWKHYGKELLTMYISSHPKFNNIPNWNDHIDKLLTEVYIKSIQELDGHDNGISPIEGGKRNYWTHLSLGGIISSMNTHNTNDEEEQMIAFKGAVSLFGTIFEIKLEEIIRKYFDYITSYEIVDKLLKEFENYEYLIIKDEIPTIYKCLSALDSKYRIKFLIFQSSENITIRTRNKKNDMHTSLVPLLSYDQTIEKLNDNKKDDVIFVHKGLFTAKTKTLETALKIVELALNNRPSQLTSVPESYYKFPSIETSNLKIIGGLSVLGMGVGGYYLLSSNQ